MRRTTARVRVPGQMTWGQFALQWFPACGCVYHRGEGDVFGRGGHQRRRDGFGVLDGAYPVVGHIPEMYRRFHSLCARGRATHGPLFWIHGGPGAAQIMCADPSGLALLKHRDASTAFYAEGFGALLKRTLFSFDGDAHRSIRGVLSPPFTPRNIRRSDALTIIEEAGERGFAAWESQSQVKVLKASQAIAMEIIFRMIGVPHRDVLEWQKQFQRYLLAGIPSGGRIQGPVKVVAGRARTWLDDRLARQVERLRERGDDTSFIGSVSNARDDAGRLLDLELLVPNLRLLVLAGHETTASGLAWAILHLADRPDFQRRLIEEAGGHDDLADRCVDQEQFTFAERVFREALRLYPPIHSVIRRAEADIELDVGTIPRGRLVNVPFVHLLRDPSRFERPAVFDPDRWDGRPRPGGVETAMFSAGPHFCLGYHLAIAEGTLLLSLLGRWMARTGRRLAVASADGLPSPIYIPLAHPPRGVEIEIRPARD